MAKVQRPSMPSFRQWLSSVGADSAVQSLADLLANWAIFIVDGQSRIVFWSLGAEQLLGFPKEEAIGRRYQEILGFDGGRQASQAKEGEAVQVARADGSLIRVLQFSQPCFDKQDRPAGFIMALQPPAGPLAQPRLREAGVESLHGLITRDPIMKQAFQIIRNVAETEATVLIRGESGTGKELVARALHGESPRRAGPFLAVNCAALAPALLESELFGHVRGAFTGAIKDHAGLFQRADGGTLFLDEVAELPLELQAKLLRVLQERSFMPVGGHHTVTVDVRIIAATHRSLREEVKAGRFREDLMYRLRVVPIFLPPLRQRRRDISLLLWHFIERQKGPRRINRIEPDAMKALLDYHWPGNVRELQNVVEYAFAVGRGDVWRMSDLPPEFREVRERASADRYESRRDQPDGRANALPTDLPSEGARIRQALAAAGGRIDRAAELLGMSRATFWRKRKKHGL